MMFEIDGGVGEGGGQILRTALTLSMLLNCGVRIRNIRAGRPKPGLMRQHLACVLAAQEVCGAEVRGAQLGSQALEFYPGAVKGGQFCFDIGSAGSTTLLFQTILLPLLSASEPSKVVLKGGTHNPMAPSLTFIEKSFLPLLRAMGAELSIEVTRWGYMPAGGGEWRVDITPKPLRPIERTERGSFIESQVTAYLSGLKRNIAERELAEYEKLSTISPSKWAVLHPEANCSGNLLTHELLFTHGGYCFVELGEVRLRAEAVAQQLHQQVQAFMAENIALDAHLTDQMMLPMWFAGGGLFAVGDLTEHAATNRLLIERLTGCQFQLEQREGRNLLSLTNCD
ncbi:MAG: RNA 3'-terminal phosphate cyclase [Pseudomonadales bacterium]|nr:RNA 3'-terminal phosphate cyclase [Pseudomonadales bacterium]